MERTRKIRTDFRSIITPIVRRKFYDFFEYLKLLDDDSKYVQHICWISGNYLTVGAMKSLTYGTARAYALLDNMNQTRLENDLLYLASENFRSPASYFAPEWLKIILKYLPNFNHWKYMRGSACELLLMRQESEARKFALSMHYAMGHNVAGELGFGKLLQHAIDTVQDFTFSSNATEAAEFMSSFVARMSNIFMGIDFAQNDSQRENIPVTLKNLLEFLGPRKDTYQAIHEQHDQTSFGPCKMVDNRNPQPCSVNPLSECCKLEKAISSHRESVLSLMKYVIGPQSMYVLEQSEKMQALLSTKEFQYEKRNKSEDIVSIEPTILFCNYGMIFSDIAGNIDPAKKIVRNCHLFKKTFTNGGLGYTFNAEPFWKMYKENIGNNAFFRQINDFGEENDASKSAIRAERHGSSHGLELLIWLDDIATSVTLHDPSTVPDMQNDAIPLRPGYEHRISVVPSTVHTAKSALEYPPPKRNCLDQTESRNLKVFKTYSQPGCLLECQLRVAIEACNCSTWDFPVLDDSVNYCTVGQSTKCFKDKMADLVLPKECSCPNDCSMVQYAISNTLIPIPYSEVNAGSYYYKLLRR